MESKIFTIFAILILLASGIGYFCHAAGAFATIAMTGLRFASPQIAGTVDIIICISNPLLCAQGKIIGAVTGEVYKAIAEASPEAAKAISTYNTVKGYADTGAEIVEELKLDEEGNIKEGTMLFTKETEIGTFLGLEEGIEANVANAKIIKKEGKSAITFIKEEGSYELKTKEGVLTYRDFQEGARFEVDNKEGKVTGAHFKTIEKKGLYKYVFGNNKEVTVTENTKVEFDGENVIVHGIDKEIRYLGKTIKLSGESVTILEKDVMGAFSIGKMAVFGKVSIKDDGYLLHEGGHIIDSERDIVIFSHETRVLFANPNAYSFDEAKGYEGSIVWQSGDKINFILNSEEGADFEVIRKGVGYKAKEKAKVIRVGKLEEIEGDIKKTTQTAMHYRDGGIEMNYRETVSAEKPDEASTTYGDYEVSELIKEGAMEFAYCQTRKAGILGAIIGYITGYAEREICNNVVKWSGKTENVKITEEDGKYYVIKDGKKREAEKELLLVDGKESGEYVYVVSPSTNYYEYYDSDGVMIHKADFSGPGGSWNPQPTPGVKHVTVEKRLAKVKVLPKGSWLSGSRAKSQLEKLKADYAETGNAEAVAATKVSEKEEIAILAKFLKGGEEELYTEEEAVLLRESLSKGLASKYEVERIDYIVREPSKK